MSLKRMIQLVVSVILLGVLIQWIDLGQVKNALASADLFYLILALIVTTLNRILMPIKWNLLLRAKEIRVSWYEVTKIYYTSNFFGVFLPPTIGSDSVRAYLTAKKGPNFTDVISSSSAC